MASTSSITDYLPNNLNQYREISGTTYSYDDNGNLIWDGAVSYGYSPENHLIAVTTPGASISYSYDPLDRLASRTVDGQTTRFLYSGAEVIAEYDQAGNLLRRYIPGSSLDVVYYRWTML